MAISLSQFRTRFPEFASRSDDEVNLALSDAADDMDVTRWGVRYDTGQAFLAAHYLAITPSTGSAVSGSVGAVTQATTGPIAVTKNIPMAKNDVEAMLGSTMYGQRYKALRHRVGMGGAVV